MRGVYDLVLGNISPISQPPLPPPLQVIIAQSLSLLLVAKTCCRSYGVVLRFSLKICTFYRPKANLFCSKVGRNSLLWLESRLILSNQPTCNNLIYRMYSNKRPTSNKRPPRIIRQKKLISAHPQRSSSQSNSNKRSPPPHPLE